MREARCQGCNRALLWAKTKNGKNVPLEKVAVIEVIDGIAIEGGDTVLVNHFKTCPKADHFSGRGKGT